MSAAPPIPTATNLIVAVSAIAVSLACLWGASHAHVWWGVAVAAFIFAFSNNTIFSLHHEAVHRGFSPNPAVNEAAGTLFAAFSPRPSPSNASAISATIAATAATRSSTTIISLTNPGC